MKCTGKAAGRATIWPCLLEAGPAAPLVMWWSVALVGTLLCEGCVAQATREESASAPPQESPADLYVGMAAAYLQRGQMDAAVERAQRALQEDRHSARAHYMMAIVRERLGEREAAEQSFRRAVELEPNNPDFRNAWGAVLCRQQRYDEAAKQFEQAFTNPLYKTPEVALMNAADCARRAGDLVAAETHARNALGANPEFPPALLFLAERDYERGAFESARGFMARYSRVGEVTPKALLLALRIERSLGNKKIAAALEASLRQRFPDAPEIMQIGL